MNINSLKYRRLKLKIMFLKHSRIRFFNLLTLADAYSFIPDNKTLFNTIKEFTDSTVF